MAQANCIDIACLRLAPTETLMRANDYLTLHVPAGGIAFSVVVDGDFVPDLPGRLFLEGKYHKTLTSVIVANTEYEVCPECSCGSLFLIVKDRVMPTSLLYRV